jgi:hypothetical protein
MKTPEQKPARTTKPGVWYRSVLLDDESCPSCLKLDLTEIPGPDHPLWKDCEKGKEGCRCMPYMVIKREVY